MTMAAETRTYIVVHRELGALCGLARSGFRWQQERPGRTPVVFADPRSAEVCCSGVNRVYCSEECKVQEYRKGEGEQKELCLR